MELIEYIGIGLAAIVGLGVSVIVLYVVGNLICEPIVRKFDMYIDRGSHRTYSDLSEEEKRHVEYLEIVVGKIALTVFTIFLSALGLLAIGYSISTLFRS